MTLAKLYQLILLLLASMVGGLSQAAQPFTSQDLARMLSDNAPPSVGYEEVRESPWLSTPVISRGTLHASAPMLEKKSHPPAPQTWRLYPDHMEWFDANETRVIRYETQPQLGALANALRGVVFGDFSIISNDFNVHLEGTPESWRLRLTPATVELSGLLKELEFHGNGTHIEKFIIIEAQGDTTTTVLSYVPLP